MEGLRAVELVNIEEQARMRLIRLDSATSLEDLRALRGNRLEALSGPGEIAADRAVRANVVDSAVRQSLRTAHGRRARKRPQPIRNVSLIAADLIEASGQ